MLPSALIKKLSAGRKAEKPPASNGKPQQPLKPHNKRKSEATAPAEVSAPKRAANAKNAKPPKPKPNGAAAAAAAAHKKPLTTDEIKRLQESAGSLTNENLFGLQIDEIVRATETPPKYAAFVADWLAELNAFLGAVRSDDRKVASAAQLKTAALPIDAAGLTVPPFQFQFVAPKAAAYLIGSLATGTGVGPTVHADVAVEMPAQCFQKADHLCLVYHQKRALYAQRLAAALQKWPKAGEVRYTFFGGDRLRPVVQLRPGKATAGKHQLPTSGLNKLRINLHLVAEQNAFKLGRFLPATSNVRSALFAAKPLRNAADTGTEQLHATPHYNAAILRDLALRQNELFVQRLLQPDAQRPVREALLLAKLWLRTRGLRQHGGGCAFGGWILAALAVWLLKQRRIHVTMPTYDVLRQLWIALATSRWHEADGGIALAPEPAVALPIFAQHFDVVFVDVSGYGNLCADVPLDVYLRVRDESARALAHLATATIATFRHLFADRRPAYQQYDHIVTVAPDAADVQRWLADAGHAALVHDFCAQRERIAVRLVAAVLRQGFGRRVDSMTPLPVERLGTTTTTTWPVGESPPTAEPTRLRFGLILNAEFCTDVIDRGPQADQLAEADAFRAFWGASAEMRRFQDGSIVEACVWTAAAAPLAERRLICGRIAVHLLRHHFGIGAEKVIYVAHQLDVATRAPDGRKWPAEEGAIDGGSEAPPTAEHLALSVVRSFDELGRQLRSLDGIPLAITAVTGASPVFRYCEVEPIIAQAAVHTDEASGAAQFHSTHILEAVLELAPSGRWPENLAALLRLKAAFCVRIAAALRDQCQLAASSNGHWIDVLRDGFHYRLRIGLAKELMLLKRTVTPKGVIAYRDNAASRRYERMHVRLPRVTVLLHALYHRHSSFGPAVQMAKRWLRAQLIDAGLWPEECVELLMARVYTVTETWPVPVQPQAAFGRWLQVLATSDWRRELVLLNVADETLAEARLQRLHQRFEAEREAFPALCIVTPAAAPLAGADGQARAAAGDWTVWSAEAPQREIVVRVAQLAAHSLAAIEQALDACVELDPRRLFVPSLAGYDAIIRLRRSEIQRTNLCEFVSSRRRAKTKTAPATILSPPPPPPAGWNAAARFVAALRAGYDEFALFFWDPCGGGDVVAVMWRPAVRVEREFAASAIVGCRQSEQSESAYVCNVEQLVEDFRVIGHGLVDSVTLAEAEA